MQKKDRQKKKEQARRRWTVTEKDGEVTLVHNHTDFLYV